MLKFIPSILKLIVKIKINNYFQVGNYSFVGISLNGLDYTDSLIQRKFGIAVDIHTQKQLILQSLKTNYTIPRTISKSNQLNISESKQMIMSHLASNRASLNIASTVQQSNIAPFKMNPVLPSAMPFASQNQPQMTRLSNPLYSAGSVPANTHLYDGVADATYNPTVDSVNNLNHPHLSRNPYSPQASATYNNQIPSNRLNQQVS